MLGNLLRASLRSLTLWVRFPLPSAEEMAQAYEFNDPDVGVSQLRHLTHLSIRADGAGVALDAEWLPAFLDRLPEAGQLCSLWADGFLMPEAFVGQLQKMSGLRRLHLTPYDTINTKSTAIPEEVLSTLPNPSALRDLRLYTGGSVVPFEMAYMRRFISLVILDIHVEGAAEPRDFRALADLENLRKVVLKHPRVRETLNGETFRMLTRGWSDLRWLDLRDHYEGESVDEPDPEDPPALHIGDLKHLGRDCPRLSALYLEVDTSCSGSLDKPSSELSRSATLVLSSSWMSPGSLPFVFDFVKALFPRLTLFSPGYPAQVWGPLVGHYAASLPKRASVLDTSDYI